MKINKNEELQSRREFFKNAARAALPVIGAVIVSQLPMSAQATEMGCTGTCYGGCKNGCGGCDTTCEGGCKNYGCRGYCNK